MYNLHITLRTILRYIFKYLATIQYHSNYNDMISDTQYVSHDEYTMIHI